MNMKKVLPILPNIIFVILGIASLIVSLELELDGTLGFILVFGAFFFIALGFFWRNNPLRVIAEIISSLL